MEKGLMVSVYRDADIGDCTNGGVSSKVNSAVAVMNGRELGPFAPREGMPALYLASWCGKVIACPENLEETAPRKERPGVISYANVLGECTIGHLNGWMFGGNFVFSSDSRFAKLTRVGYPIPIYDRKE